MYEYLVTNRVITGSGVATLPPEPKPNWRTEARLASQLGLDAVAVTTWFRARRVKAKRSRMRAVGTAILLTLFVGLAIFYMYELNGEEGDQLVCVLYPSSFVSLEIRCIITPTTCLMS
jgi:hypothetical protein